MDNPYNLQGTNTSANQQHISRQETLTMSVSTLFGSLHLDRTNARTVNTPEGEAATDLA